MTTATIGRGTRFQIDNGDGVWREIDIRSLSPAPERHRGTLVDRRSIEVDCATAEKVPPGRQTFKITAVDFRTYFASRYRRALRKGGMVRFYGVFAK